MPYKTTLGPPFLTTKEATRIPAQHSSAGAVLGLVKEEWDSSKEQQRVVNMYQQESGDLVLRVLWIKARDIRLNTGEFIHMETLSCGGEFNT